MEEAEVVRSEWEIARREWQRARNSLRLCRDGKGIEIDDKLASIQLIADRIYRAARRYREITGEWP